MHNIYAPICICICAPMHMYNTYALICIYIAYMHPFAYA